jgi:glycosyltransferase involved in cell wall biosynthesis
MNRKIRVLFLPKWYPHRYDPMPGLFIQRQAEALTAGCDVAVIYVHPDPDCPNKIEVEFSEENEVRVLRVYYRVNRKPAPMVGKALNLWRFYRANMKAIHSIRQFSPDLVHAHILTRLGLVAWRVSRKMHVPLVISEHWSRYFPESNSYQGFIRKLLTWFVVKQASLVIAVSEPLKVAMQSLKLDNRNFQVIPNVVDTGLFIPGTAMSTHPVRNIVHISCFEDRSKNISGFLDAILELSRKRSDFKCQLIGDGPDMDPLTAYARSLGIIDTFVTFNGLKTGDELVAMINNADFTVVSSNYETFGTVVIESLACGIPVVATRVGVAPAIIDEHNGILVQPCDPDAMVQALNRMMDQCRTYNKVKISSGIPEKFSKVAIGQQLTGLYRELIPEIV